MDLETVRSETAELFREHGLEEPELDYVTEELVTASSEASDEVDGETETDDAGVEVFTVNGHHLLYCPAHTRTYICYTPECSNAPRRRLRTSAVFRIAWIGYCGVPTRKYKMFVRS